MKIYLSRSATRAMALDHPIGDPTGGAAYGEKNDPVSAVIAVGSMVGTGAAVMAGTATLFEGLAFAGAALSLTGNITGNKTLSKLGMITGIAGGVGMLGETAFGTASSSMGDTFGYGKPAADLNASQAFSQSPYDANTATRASQYAPPETGGTPSTGTPSTGTPGSVAPPAGVPTGESLASQIASNPNAATGAQAVNVAPGASQGLVAGNAPSLTPAGSVNDLAASQAWSGQNFNPADATRLADYTTPKVGVMDSFNAGNYGQALGQMGSNVMDVAKSNPGAAMVMGQAAGGVANWLSGKTDAEINALQAQTGYSNAKAQEVQNAIALEKKRRANLNAGYTQVNAGMQVNPNAQIQQAWIPPAQQPAGLIAGARG